MAKEFWFKRHGITYTPTGDLTTIGQGDGGPNSIQRFIPFIKSIQDAIDDGDVSGLGFNTIQHNSAMSVGVSTITYVAPTALGVNGTLTIPNWGSLMGTCIYVLKGTDYNDANDFVLDIVDFSGNTNTWDLQSVTDFDVYKPNIEVSDAGNTIAPIGNKESFGYDTSVAFTWSNGTLTLTFNGANFKSKLANIIRIG